MFSFRLKISDLNAQLQKLGGFGMPFQGPNPQPYLDTGRGIAISKGQSLQLERCLHAHDTLDVTRIIMIYSCTCNLVSNALDSKFYMKCTEESPFLDSLDFRSVLKRKTGTMPVQILLRDSFSPNHYCLII